MPTQEQARRAAWRAVDPHQYGRRIDLAFPLESRASTRDQEMLIEFKNGSTWQLLGSPREIPYGTLSTQGGTGGSPDARRTTRSSSALGGSRRFKALGKYR